MHIFCCQNIKVLNLHLFYDLHLSLDSTWVTFADTTTCKNVFINLYNLLGADRELIDTFTYSTIEYS